MTENIHTQRNLAPDGVGGGYAGVLPAGSPGSVVGDSLRQGVEAAGRHQLILRFALFNMAASALVGAAWTQGWIGLLLKADDTGLSVGIFLVFLAGLGVCARRIWQTSMELEQVRALAPLRGSATARHLADVAHRDSGARATAASRLKLVASGRIAPVLQFANSLVLLGLIGTVVGFIIALSGVDPESAGDASAIAPMVSGLIHGMSVALYTTLVGAVLHLWLKVNYLVLVGGVVQLLDRLVARGESDARP